MTYNNKFRLGDRFYYSNYYTNEKQLLTITGFIYNGYGILRKLLVTDSVSDYYFSVMEYNIFLNDGRVEKINRVEPIQYIKKLELV